MCHDVSYSLNNLIMIVFDNILKLISEQRDDLYGNNKGRAFNQDLWVGYGKGLKIIKPGYG